MYRNAIDYVNQKIDLEHFQKEEQKLKLINFEVKEILNKISTLNSKINHENLNFDRL